MVSKLVDCGFFLAFLALLGLSLGGALYTGRERRAQEKAAVDSWRDAVQSGRCKVESFGFDRNGYATSAVYLCGTGRHVGPVIR